MRRLGVFAKYWQAGKVKTRLAATLGAREAAAIYHACLATILARCSELNLNRVLVYSPAQRRADFQQLAAEQWELCPQADGDLGCRMGAFFDASFDAGCDRVVLIGSDSPTLPVSRISDAFEALGQSSVVLGPCGDGGYYLVGARQRTPEIFDGIDWGTSQVMTQTLDRLQNCSTSFQQLEPWYDVDDAVSLEHLREELARCQDDKLLIELRELIETVRRLDRD